MRLEDYVGEEVDVEPFSDDAFAHEFRGTVIGIRNGCLQVRDQDENVWEVLQRQVTLAQPRIPALDKGWMDGEIVGGNMLTREITIRVPVMPPGLVMGSRARIDLCR